jgi:uncharacterized protein YcgI (DUF1989 family)
MPMAVVEIQTLPARRGKAVRLRKGQALKVINTHGQQVVDTWAFNADDLSEFMSMEHLRQVLNRIMPRAGDPLATNQRRPILTLIEDTSPGIHDTLLAACDIWRYRNLGCTGHHDNCRDNLFAGMAELGLAPPECPEPAEPLDEHAPAIARSLDIDAAHAGGSAASR